MNLEIKNIQMRENTQACCIECYVAGWSQNSTDVPLTRLKQYRRQIGFFPVTPCKPPWLHKSENVRRIVPWHLIHRQ